jgi:hypothetical protein
MGKMGKMGGRKLARHHLPIPPILPIPSWPAKCTAVIQNVHFLHKSECTFTFFA